MTDPSGSHDPTGVHHQHLQGYTVSTVCVFCGSSTGQDPRYAEGARSVGETIAHRSLRLVYGGSTLGLMGLMAERALQGGSQVIGILPRLLHERCPALVGSEVIVVESMHERKAMMYEMADAFIAMPGGIGTLEELSEVLTWNQIGYISKPVGILNISGYYDDLLAQLDTMRREGFMKGIHRDMVFVSEDPSELLDHFSRHVSVISKLPAV